MIGTENDEDVNSDMAPSYSGHSSIDHMRLMVNTLSFLFSIASLAHIYLFSLLLPFLYYDR